MNFITTASTAMRAATIYLAATIFMLTNPLNADASSTRFSAGITPSYYSGTYGTTTTTEIFYLPVDLKIKSGDLTLKATVPYIRVRSQNAVLAGGAVVGNAGGQPRVRSGLGDIWLEGRYRLRLDDAGNDFIPYVKIKFGTASRAQGLGTGANDVEFGGKFRSRIDRDIYPFVKVGYRMHGQAAGLVLNDYVIYQLGFSYVVDPDNVATLLYAGHQSSQPGLAAASEMIGAWNIRSSSNLNLQLFGLLGLSNGSPDYGAGLGIHYSF